MSRWSRRISGANMSVGFDFSEIEGVIAELKSTESEIGKATSRALRRTATSLRVMASKRLLSELQVKRAMELRRRMAAMKLRTKKASGEQVIGMWFGLNDMAVSRMKGRMKPHPGGASFRGIEFPGAFIAKPGRNAPRSIYKRSGRGRFPLVEQAVPIKDTADPIIEDDIFPEATRIFTKFLLHELRFRAGLRAEGSGQ